MNLGILDAGEAVVISTVESPQAVRMASKVGNRRRLATTALGKVCWPGCRTKRSRGSIRLKGLPRLTPNTLVSRSALVAEIARVRQQGYALDNQENEMDGRCIGAPVCGPDGRVLAALSISGRVFRMNLDRAHSLVPKLQETCAAISESIRT